MDSSANAPDMKKKEIPQNQAWGNRAPIMEQLIKVGIGQRPVRLLEIGVWYGLGSTDIWLTHCAPGSEIFLVDPWRPYASQEDLRYTGWDWKGVDDQSTDAFLSAFLATKRHQARRGGDVKIHLTRGDSASFLPALASDSFDFIYIDGDHKYANAKSDIAQAKRLVKKDYGIICGDDLDREPTPELYEIARRHPDQDVHEDPSFHPGVLAAVVEEFPKVNMINGVWWICCVNGQFTVDTLRAVPQAA